MRDVDKVWSLFYSFVNAPERVLTVWYTFVKSLKKYLAVFQMKNAGPGIPKSPSTVSDDSLHQRISSDQD